MIVTCRDGEIGRRVGLKIRYSQGCVGSSPSPGTKRELFEQKFRQFFVKSIAKYNFI